MLFIVRSLLPGTDSVQQLQWSGADEVALRTQLQAAGHTVLSIRPVKVMRWPVAKRQRHQFPLFCKEIRTLIRAGMTVVEAVETLAERGSTTNQEVNLPQVLLTSLRQGQALSVGLERLPDAPPVLIAAVRAGERTSNLAEALDDYLRFDGLIEQLKRKVVSASIYPALVTALGVSISLFLLTIVMPNFARMYQNLRGKASDGTALIIELSQFLSTYRMQVLAAVLFLLVMGVWWIQSGLAKKAFIAIALASPWLRNRVKDFQLAMMYQALALLLKGGYPMIQAMEVAGQSALSANIGKALSSARTEIERGCSVARSLAEAGLCDDVDRRLMSAAERNGDFYVAADVVSRMHGEQFELFVERVTRVVEPLLLLLVALMVGTIVVMMYLPVFDMATRLR